MPRRRKSCGSIWRWRPRSTWRAGMDPREARRQAHVRLGGVDAIREAVRDARGWRPVEDLVRDFGYALRIRAPESGLHCRRRRVAGHPHRLQQRGLHDHRLVAVPAAAGLSCRGTRRRLHEATPVSSSTRRPSYPDYLDLRAENDVFTDMAAHSSMVAAVRVDEAVDLVMGEDGDGKLPSASRHSAGAGPAAKRRRTIGRLPPAWP